MSSYIKLFFPLVAFMLISACSSNEDLLEADSDFTSVPTFYTMKADTSFIVSPSKVTNIINRYFDSKEGKNNSRSSKTPSSISTIDDSFGNPLIYVVNYEMGFALVSARKSYAPILAFSDGGSFNTNNIKGNPIELWLKNTISLIENPSTLDSIDRANIEREWNFLTDEKIYSSRSTDDYSDVISSAISTWQSQGYRVYKIDDCGSMSLPQSIQRVVDNAKNYVSEIRDKMLLLVKQQTSSNRVNALIKTEWQQGSPYNTSLAVINGTKGYLGCVPIAVSQVMYYHKYPYDKDFNSMPLIMYSYDFSTTLPDFIKEVGEKCGIKYDNGGTSASANDALNALKSYGYNATKANYSSSKISANLNLKRPVLMAGSNHMWICDGYASYSNVTEYKVVQYTGDFEDINPTMAFATVATDSESSSSLSNHMVWGWQTDLNGFFYTSGNSWTVNRGAGNETYKCDDIIVDIYPNN